jgi:hypothetical protein
LKGSGKTSKPILSASLPLSNEGISSIEIIVFHNEGIAAALLKQQQKPLASGQDQWQNGKLVQKCLQDHT